MDEVTTIVSQLGEFTVHSAGAQVSQWDSATFGPLIFSPDRAQYGVGNSPHGGIPVCFPWFGVPTHADQEEGEVQFLGQAGASSKHGWARLLNWTRVSSEIAPDGSWVVVHRLTERDVPDSVAQVPPFQADLCATFSADTLTLSLDVTNTGEQGFQFEEALHTYFIVGEARRAWIEGLEGVRFIDATTPELHVATHMGPVAFDGEVDRVYMHEGTEADPGMVTIVDPVMGRRVQIEGEGSETTVIWNPGPELAARIGDLADEEWNQFVCVETANAGGAAVLLEPGQSHKLTARYTVRAA